MKDTQIATQLDTALSEFGNAALEEIKGEVKSKVNEQIQKVADKVQKKFVDKIGDKILRDASTKTLSKLSSFDGIVGAFKSAKGDSGLLHQTYGEMGRDIEKFIGGKMTRADLMESLADKAENYISKKVNQVVTTVALEIAGPFAPIIGEMAAEIVCEMFRDTVAPFINAARRAQMAREKYEKLHEIYEEAIRQMQIRRQKFIEQTAKLFGEQEELIEKSLTDLNDAFGVNDHEKVTAALGTIASGIGGQELDIKSFDDFKDRIKKRKKLVM